MKISAAQPFASDRSSRPRVGLPRALLYHRYGTLWESFLRGLGLDVVVSPPTDVEIARRGDALAPDEACLPVKLFLGHVATLADEVDFVFAARLVSVRRREENCQKFMGGYDLIANTLPGVPLLTYTVDMRWRQRERPAMCAMGARFAGAPRVLASYARAKARQLASELEARRREADVLAARDGRPKVLLVGHSYVAEDALIGEPVERLLRREGLDVVRAEPFGRGRARGARRISRDLYWTYSRELLGAVADAGERVDGIVFLTSFPCGPDSLVTELCRLKLTRAPALELVLDGFYSDVGLQTRVESFADIVKAKAAPRGAA